VVLLTINSSCSSFRGTPTQLSSTNYLIGDFLSPCEKKEVVGASFYVGQFLLLLAS
jgi:hypothetical protein